MNMQKINTQIYIYIHLSKKIKNWTTNFLIECQKLETRFSQFWKMSHKTSSATEASKKKFNQPFPVKFYM